MFGLSIDMKWFLKYKLLSITSCTALSMFQETKAQFAQCLMCHVSISTPRMGMVGLLSRWPKKLATKPLRSSWWRSVKSDIVAQLLLCYCLDSCKFCDYSKHCEICGGALSRSWHQGWQWSDYFWRWPKKLSTKSLRSSWKRSVESGYCDYCDH